MVYVTEMSKKMAVLSGAWLLVGLLSFAGCRPRQSTAVDLQPAIDAATVKFADGEQVVLVYGAHDTLGGARLGLEEALRLPVDLPLPYPRVERHADRFRVVLARGTYASLRKLTQALGQAGHPAEVLLSGQAGGDDVIRLGIVCTEGQSVPLYAAPLAAPPQEAGRLKHGQVVVLKEDEEEPRHGLHDGDEEASGGVAEQGFLTVLQPQPGLVRGPDVLLPADCTPRDEDNDDGNGRILGASSPGEFGRLCLTTRFAGRAAHLLRADVVAVTPSYRRCLRFPGAGTFDGFDQSRSGSHFAVEVDERSPPLAGPQAAAASQAAPFLGLRLYAVGERGALSVRGQWPGLSRPGFLGDHLVALLEEPATLAVVVIEGAGRREASDATPLPAPRRIVNLAASVAPRLSEKVPVHRPAAPTLSNGRVRVSFLRGCRPDWEKRVRAAAKSSYVQCVLELEVEAGLDGQKLERRCRLDNAGNSLEEPLPIACP